MSTPSELQNVQDSRFWRCGVCLFMLPGDLATIEDDYPPHEGMTASSKSLEGPHQCYLSALWRSVERGCDACASIASIAGLSRDKHPDTTALQWAYRWLSLRSGLNKEYQIFVEPEGGKTAARDLRDIHPGLNAGTSPSVDTSSTETFDMLKARMRTCLDHHKQCFAPDEPGPMPKRILYVEDANSSTVRLIGDTSSMTPQPYMCLSHRWADQTASSSLTLDRLPTFKHQIPKNLLYPLLRDAFVATERLGFRYLWIDCLCICQDDLNDWNEQAAEMSTIYENAVVTISALDAQLNDWRLFYKGSPEKTQKLCSRGGKTIMIAEASTSHPFFVDTVGTKYRASSASEEYPLLKRGWVYQERLLARRIAHFTRREVIWECKESMSCECGHNEEAWAMVKRQSPKLSDMIWGGICAEYTKTELSIDADRLPALSGVARRFGEAHGWTYLAGVWREDPDLLTLLLWFNSETHTRQHIPGVPSWSWASVRGATFHPIFQRWGLVFRVVEHELIPGAVPYSMPSSIRLVVEGPCSHVAVKFNPGSFDTGVMTFPGDGAVYDCFTDYLVDDDGKCEIEKSNDIIFFLCLRDDDGPCGLLLRPSSLVENAYERFAFFSRWVTLDDSLWKMRRITLV